jgi:hypothetical protein
MFRHREWLEVPSPFQIEDFRLKIAEVYSANLKI